MLRRLRRLRGGRKSQLLAAALGAVAALGLLWLIAPGGSEHEQAPQGAGPTNVVQTVQRPAAKAFVPPDQAVQRPAANIAVPPAAASEQQDHQGLLEKKQKLVQQKKSVGVRMYSETGCKGPPEIVNTLTTESRCTSCFDLCGKQWTNGHHNKDMLGSVKSIEVFGDVPAGWRLSLDQNCVGTYSYSHSGGSNFLDGLTVSDGCTELGGKSLASVGWTGVPDEGEFYVPQSYRIMYSAESATYFSYQAYANLLGFQRSKQQQSPPTGYIRLLTAPEEDDLAVAQGGILPTFTSPKHPVARGYSPFNKADAIDMYMQSAVTPAEEVMVVIDPDNWLVASVARVAARVKAGAGVGAAAFFYNEPQVETLWRDCVCNLHARKGVCAGLPPVDFAHLERQFKGQEEVLAGRQLLDGRACDAVPYFVHRDDLRSIAPLWKLIIVELMHVQSTTTRHLKRLQLNWCSEMYGYIFAAAALKIKHSIAPGLQIRDVDGKITYKQWEEKPILMIHMGRAWFPKDYAHEHASQWIHTEGHSLRPPNTEQMWCKCNETAADEVPWPLPPVIDFVSNITLTYIHDSYEQFGKPPSNRFRRPGYHVTT